MNKICLKSLWGCVNKVCGEGLWVAKIISNPGVRSNPESNPESNPVRSGYMGVKVKDLWG